MWRAVSLPDSELPFYRPGVGIMLVNPARHPHVKRDLGEKFIDWLTSPDGQRTIAEYQIDGAQLFFPDVKGLPS